MPFAPNYANISLCGRVAIAKFYRINDRIQASSLRVIGPDGTQLGVLSKEAALSKAQKLELDLIEVASQANPPVARILDYQKFKFDESKKERVAKKNASEVELKEIWLSPRIADHDLEVRLNRAEEFLSRGDKVKLTVRFRGREMAHPEVGHRVLDKVYLRFGDKIVIDREAKFEGRNLSVIIGANKQGVKKDAEVKNEEVTNQENKDN